MEEYSFSKLTAFHQCPYQYYLQYIDKSLPKQKNAFAQYGSFAHQLLEKYAKGELNLFELADKFKDEYIIKVTYDFPPNRYVDLASSYFKDGVDFFTNFEGLDDYEILGVEDEFKENINDDYILTGFIDLILKDKDGNLILHDWKSKAGFKSKAEQKKYARQLYIYSVRIKRKFGRFPDRMQFGCFRKQKTISVDFNEKDFDEAMNWMDSTVRQIRECENFEPKQNRFFCSNLCDFRNDCLFK